jgi:alpha-tubulin suppressor-like RCC1 family protein
MGVNLLVDVDGTVRSWGFTGGEGTYMGDGSGNEGERKEPTLIAGLHDIIDASVGFGHALVLQRDGTVLAWGRNNGCELAVTDDRRRLTPIRIIGVSNAVQVAAGMEFSAALLADGTVRVWGSNKDGLLANGKAGYGAECATSPVPVEGLSGVKRIFVSEEDVVALMQDGTVWAWGSNGGGELCDGTTEQRTHPVQIAALKNVVDVAIGGHSVFVLADGTVWMCGTNADGAMGNVPAGKHPRLTKVPGVANAVAVQTAGSTMVRLKDGTLLGWGEGMHGSLGDGFIDKVWPTPHPPVGLGPVLAHFYASNSGFAIKADGTVMAWGIFVGGPHEWALKPIPFYKVKLDN